MSFFFVVQTLTQGSVETVSIAQDFDEQKSDVVDIGFALLWFDFERMHFVY